MRRRLLHKIDSGTHIFKNATTIYSLWNIYNVWTKAILKIRRSSDNTTAYVFFNGSTISLSSLISTSSETTPSATTLSTWVGANSAFVETWYGQRISNNLNYTVTQTTQSSQPRVINSGVIETENGLPTINFTSSSTNLLGGYLPSLNSGLEHSIFTVSANKDSASAGFLMVTKSGTGSRYAVINDRRSSPKRIAIINTTTDYYVNLLAQQNSSDARLLNTTMDASSNLRGYFNNIIQETTAITGSYDNDTLILGIQGGGTFPLNGTISFIAVMPENLDSDLSTYNDFINDYYSIY